MVYKKKIPVDLRRRKGRVLIHEDIINNNPEDMLIILSNFIVVRTEFNLIYPGIEWQGYCHLFEPITEGEVLPEYDFVLTRNWQGQVTNIEAIRKER